MSIRGCQHKKSVVFYRNDKPTIKVDKEKLIAKSSYFRAMFKNFYKDQTSDFIDVCFPAKQEIFNKVMQLVSSNSITLDINSIFETYHLAVFLHIDCLQQLCLDHFTLNLNRNNVQSQLELIEKNSYLDKEFKQRALTFRESGNPSISGLYFLQRNNRRLWCLKVKCSQHESVHVLRVFEGKRKVSSLHHVDNMLCLMTSAGRSGDVVLCQYDLLSGSTYNIELDSVNRIDDYKSSICTDDKNLYFLSQTVSNKNEFVFSLMSFSRKEKRSCLKIFKRTSISLVRTTKSTSLNKIKIHFSHCYNNKLYVFYYSPKFWLCNNYFYNTYLLVICCKSFRVLKNNKLSAENVKLGSDFPELDEIAMWNFEKMFYSEKHEKIFIKTDCYIRENFGKHVLVFDLKRDYFYFDGNVQLPSSLRVRNTEEFTTCKDGRVYLVSYYNSYSRKICGEIRVFDFVENKQLVDRGVIWESAKDEKCNGHGKLWSACFV